MKLAIVGYGVEGQAALRYWRQKGADITVCDQNSDLDLPGDIKTQLGPNYLKNLDKFDLVFRSAGINPETILAASPGIEKKITSTMNEFLRVCPTKNVVGITGTKGKGTTSTLIAKILEAVGKDVFLGGNIGLSPFDFLPKLDENSWVVLELSSFQLCDLKCSPHIAICLMVVPEHLNWHKNMAEYIEAKSQLFAHQTGADKAVYFAENDNSKRIVSASRGQKIPYFAPPGAEIENGTITIDNEVICKNSELRLLGAHNWQNTCAAVTAVWQVTQNVEAIRSVLTNFSGLEHRLEFVRELDGVKYYDDSFGTTPETAIVAIEAFDAPKVIILGGSDKGASYDELAKTVAGSNVKKALLIGDQAAKIQAALGAAGFQRFAPGGQNMTEITKTARSAAKPGDVVLLSTGCASFDMFDNYKDRGNQFKQAVNNL